MTLHLPGTGEPCRQIMAWGDHPSNRSNHLMGTKLHSPNEINTNKHPVKQIEQVKMPSLEPPQNIRTEVMIIQTTIWPRLPNYADLSPSAPMFLLFKPRGHVSPLQRQGRHAWSHLFSPIWPCWFKFLSCFSPWLYVWFLESVTKTDLLELA